MSDDRVDDSVDAEYESPSVEDLDTSAGPAVTAAGTSKN